MFTVRVHRIWWSPINLTTEPPVAIAAYRDGFENSCNRIVAPPGPHPHFGLAACRRGSTGRNAGVPFGKPLLRGGSVVPSRVEFVCKHGPGWQRVRAICDFVHHHIAF